MAKDKSPAFQWYSKDILTSQRVALMTLEEEGAYRRALDFCWLSGSLPSDPGELARIIGKGCSVETATVVKQMFTIDKKNPQKIFHDRLEFERKKQKKFKENKSKAGVESGKARRKKKLNNEHLFNSVQTERRTEDERKRTLHLQSSSSSSEERESYKKHNSLSPQDARARAKNGSGESGNFLSRFSLEICQEYAQAKYETGQGIKFPQAFARRIFETGVDDKLIQSWIDGGKVMKSPDEIALENLRKQRRNGTN